MKRYVASGLNYIFKSLDLIPDGIDDLGFCDDAFVIRVAAALACRGRPRRERGRRSAASPTRRSRSRSSSATTTRASSTYVKGLRKGAARGRTVDDIMTDASARTSFVHEVAAWAKEYQVPSFTRDVKTLIKLKAFLSAKLAPDARDRATDRWSSLSEVRRTSCASFREWHGACAISPCPRRSRS